jgi:hypothetical protein
MRARLFGLVFALALALVPKEAIIAATPSPAPAASLHPCVPLVRECPCVTIAAAGERARTEQSEANAYSIVTTLIWAAMWIGIALIAKGAVVSVVEGATSNQD